MGKGCVGAEKEMRPLWKVWKQEATCSWAKLSCVDLQVFLTDRRIPQVAQDDNQAHSSRSLSCQYVSRKPWAMHGPPSLIILYTADLYGLQPMCCFLLSQICPMPYLLWWPKIQNQLGNVKHGVLEIAVWWSRPPPVRAYVYESLVWTWHLLSPSKHSWAFHLVIIRWNIGRVCFLHGWWCLSGKIPQIF